MTFLNPGILWALAAVAVPIIIHFFNLQRPKKVLFSNVAFVKEVKRTVVRRLKFKQWLLLLLRILAISCLVLAFANPVILSDNAQALTGNRSVAIVIDNSQSMQAGNEKGTYFPQALSLSREIIRAYTTQDEFLIMTSSDLKYNYGFNQQSEVLEELKTLQIGQNTLAHTEILSELESFFSRGNYQAQELYFLSDFQESTVMQDTASVRLTDSLVSVRYVPLATREQNNVYVSDHKIVSQIIEQGEPVNMSMTLVNDGENDARDINIRVMLDGKVVTIATESLDKGSSKTKTLSFTPGNSGWLSGYIELDDYPIEYDNRRYFSLYVPDQESVLLIESESSPNVHVLYESLFEQFDTRIVNTRNLSSISLEDYRAIIWLGMSQVSTGLTDKIQQYLESGGSMMIFPGKQVDLNSANSFLKSIQLGTLENAIKTEQGIPANQTDLDHPIFDGVFIRSDEKREFDAPSFFRYYPLSLSSNTIHNRIMSLPNQAPMIVESQINNGLVYFLPFFPDNSWTDFHLKTIFAPFMFRATQIMNQTQITQSSQEIGNFSPKLIRSDIIDNILLVREEPKEENPVEIILEPVLQGGNTVINFETVNSQLPLQPGNYRMMQGDELLERISFNVSDVESRLSTLDQSKLRRYLENRGMDYVEILDAQPEQLTSRITIEKEGIPLWKYFIILAIVFLLLEILVIRLMRS